MLWGCFSSPQKKGQDDSGAEDDGGNAHRPCDLTHVRLPGGFGLSGGLRFGLGAGFFLGLCLSGCFGQRFCCCLCFGLCFGGGLRLGLQPCSLLGGF